MSSCHGAPNSGGLGSEEAAGARDRPTLEAECVMLQNELSDPVEGFKVRIRRIVAEVFAAPVRDESNLLEAGMDSITAVMFRSRMLDEFEPEGCFFSAPLVFDYPTVAALALHVAETRSLGGDKGSASEEGSAARVKKTRRTLEEQVRRVPCADSSQAVHPLSASSGAALYVRVATHLECPTYRRTTDGMQCVLLPWAVAYIGDGFRGRAALPNEQPCHQVKLSSFLMDMEPVSVAAFARFLNAVRPPQEVLSDWYALHDTDNRACHLPLCCDADGLWQPASGVELEWPMIMVSWYGANAYSLWANGGHWQDYRAAGVSFLPTEAQWEFAARGAFPRNFPWGDAPARPDLLNICSDCEELDPDLPLGDFPLAKVSAELGVSPFGPRGMAGNVWQWCRDAYDPEFYASPAASEPDAWNSAEVKFSARSERGGSWVGPASLARCSYRLPRAGVHLQL